MTEANKLTGEEVALTVRCPRCHVPKGQRCVYVAPDTRPYAYSQAYAARVARVGTPTQRAHNERRQAAREKLARPKVPSTLYWRPASQEQLQIAQAENQFLLREHGQLRAFFAVHGSIFFEEAKL